MKEDFEVKVTNEGVQVGGKFLAHNEHPWRRATNRHTTTYGNSWGWIAYGNGGEVGGGYWSNDSGDKFTGEMAAAAVTAHNKWLEDIQPTQIKVIKAKRELSKLQVQLEEKKSSYEKTKELYEEASKELSELLGEIK